MTEITKPCAKFCKYKYSLMFYLLASLFMYAMLFAPMNDDLLCSLYNGTDDSLIIPTLPFIRIYSVNTDESFIGAVYEKFKKKSLFYLKYFEFNKYICRMYILDI